ncbi:hypothetical protein L226DRAFT_459732 [Lentinus tigrinus ALCF2SS1-7]|uniref:Uncharacterized protein n=1 Tax=Lentinus tigrinus ALCF2SS1-6 TaxID=1328759 RepID=A0A5C2SC58_9APHY|nr:hypothetical protein L227DRAFT_501555 [Lentinus tigrinus ALCF2SS1-6]RPD77116.1 hypothetical protein L226DRAFT_459732 [Lentinus tigrinus ALCF2SS1-7]
MQQPSFYGGYAGLNFDVAGAMGFASQLGPQTVLQSADLNSPEVFKQNIQLAQGQIARVQSLARNALGGIQNAYYLGTNPMQTAADIAGLKQALFELVELLRQTGVGALPLEPPQVPDPRPESALVEEESRVVQALYERQQRIQDAASVVAGFLSFAGAGEQPGPGSSAAGRRA